MCPGALRNKTRSHHAGQSDRRRYANGCVWRPARNHAMPGASGSRLQAGTLSGNPVAVAAGLATLKLVQAPGFYDKLAARTRELTEGLAAAARKHGVVF